MKVATCIGALALVSGGLGGSRPPEVANLNFAPRVRIPVLVENRRLDFTFRESIDWLDRVLGPVAPQPHCRRESDFSSLTARLVPYNRRQCARNRGFVGRL